MKIAFIAPIQNLELAQRGTMHMALTHLVLQNAAYRNFYRNETMYKILDNGAFEGELNSMQQVLLAADSIQANEIVLPDYLFDWKKTVQSAKTSIQRLKSLGILKRFKLMAVPQGNDEDTWWNCMHELSELEEVDVIGLSKLSCPVCMKLSITKSRNLIINEMTAKNLWNNNKEYHLLGGSHELIDQIYYCNHEPRIRSIDTSVPIEYGKNGIYLFKSILDPKKGTDLCKAIKPEKLDCVMYNINRISTLCKGALT